MTFVKKTDGFSLVEILLVITVMTVLLSMGGALASKFANRRSVDRVTTSISSTLQLVKLKSARQGLEYRTVFAQCDDLNVVSPECSRCLKYIDYKAGDNALTISTERGDSNQDSAVWCTETSQRIGIQPGIILTETIPNNPLRYTFNPNGTLGGASGTVNVMPTNNKRGARCGTVVVSPLGRISVVQGSWSLTGGGSCKSFK